MGGGATVKPADPVEAGEAAGFDGAIEDKAIPNW
jgi:hypothetical protein